MQLNTKTVGITIRRLRIRKGITLEDVAARASLSPITVRALELGRGSTITTLLKVLSAIDEVGFVVSWMEKSNEINPMQALRDSRKQTLEPKRVSRKLNLK